MMGDRQADFRKEYRSRVAGWYNGYFHVLVIYSMGAAALTYYILHITSPRWWEWLTIPVVFLLSNLLEWSVHRYVMHRPINIQGLRAIYDQYHPRS